MSRVHSALLTPLQDETLELSEGQTRPTRHTPSDFEKEDIELLRQATC